MTLVADAQAVSAAGQVAAAVASLALLYVTVLYLRSTNELVGLQQQAVDAEREQARAARDQADAALRPVIVCVAPPSGQPPLVVTSAGVRIRLGVQNPGIAVAIADELRVTVGNDRVGCGLTRRVVAPGDTAELESAISRGSPGYAELAGAPEAGRVAASLLYLDVLGRPGGGVDAVIVYDRRAARWELE